MAEPKPYQRSYSFRAFPDDEQNARQLGLLLDRQFDEVSNGEKDLAAVVSASRIDTVVMVPPDADPSLEDGVLSVPQGQPGVDGVDGAPGASVYDTWLLENPGGTTDEFLEDMQATPTPALAAMLVQAEIAAASAVNSAGAAATSEGVAVTAAEAANNSAEDASASAAQAEQYAGNSVALAPMVPVQSDVLYMQSQMVEHTETTAGQTADFSGLTPDLSPFGTPTMVLYTEGSAGYVNGGRLTRLRVTTTIAGDITALSFTRDGLPFKRHAFQRFPDRDAGPHDIPCNLDIPKGGFLGLGVPLTGLGAHSSLPLRFFRTADAEVTEFEDDTSSSIRAMVTWTVEEPTGLIAPSLEDVAGVQTASDIAAMQAGLMEETDRERGSPDDLSTVTATSGAGTANIAHGSPIPDAGTAYELEIVAFAAGNVRVRSWSRVDNTFTQVAEQIVAVTAGHGVYPISVPVPAGGYVGGVGGGIIGMGGSGWQFYSGGTAGSTSFTDNNGTGTGTFLFKVRVASRAVKQTVVTPPAPDREHMTGGMGQSNMAGEAAAVSTRQRYGARGFNNKATALEPLVAPGVGPTEFPGFGFAIKLREYLMFEGGPDAMQSGEGMIVGRSALGGTAIGDLGPGSPEYNGAINQISAAVDDVTTAGNWLEYWGSMWVQGERDAIIATPRATYRDALIALATSHEQDARSALADFTPNRPIPLFCAQVTSAAGYTIAAQAWAIAMAQMDAADLSPLVHLACPMYHVPFVDDRHASGSGSRLLGAYLARATKHWIDRLTPFVGLRAVEWWISGNDIVLTYNRTGLTLDSAWQVPAQAQNGFSVIDGIGVDQPITSVVASGNQVTLTLGSAPAAGWSWRYGYGTSVGLGTYTGGAGNLRDNAGANDAFDGVAMHNAALLQEGVL